METNEIKIKSLAEISQIGNKIEQLAEFNLLINQKPPKEWIKENKAFTVEVNGSKVAGKYLSKNRLQFLLTAIFGCYRKEIIRYSQEGNACIVHCRVYYYNAIFDDWHFQDGIGAVGLLTNDKAELKHTSFHMAMPNAYTFAFKNACAGIGRIFGGDLYEKDNINFTPAIEKFRQIKAREI